MKLKFKSTKTMKYHYTREHGRVDDGQIVEIPAPSATRFLKDFPKNYEIVKPEPIEMPKQKEAPKPMDKMVRSDEGENKEMESETEEKKEEKPKKTIKKRTRR